MALLNDNPEAVRDLLTKAKVIAVVGMSNDKSRASYSVAKFLERQGYTIYPVNPTIDSIDGEPVYKTLTDVPEPIDIVDVFRRPEYLSEVVEQSIYADARMVWGQLGVHDDHAVERAEAAGLDIVTNQCIKIEFVRLSVQRPR